MKTDFNNLKTFDSLLVGMIFLGVVLILVQFYLALPQEGKADLFAAASILDARQAWESQMAVNEFLFEGTDEFLQEFSLAFRDLLQTNSEVKTAFASAWASFAGFSDTVAGAYKNNKSAGSTVDAGGRVLGSYIDKILNQK